jgi:hypothetical protein
VLYTIIRTLRNLVSVILQEPPTSDSLYDSDIDQGSEVTAVDRKGSEPGVSEDEKDSGGAEVDGEWG